MLFLEKKPGPYTKFDVSGDNEVMIVKSNIDNKIAILKECVDVCSFFSKGMHNRSIRHSCDSNIDDSLTLEEAFIMSANDPYDNNIVVYPANSLFYFFHVDWFVEEKEEKENKELRLPNRILLELEWLNKIPKELYRSTVEVLWGFKLTKFESAGNCYISEISEQFLSECYGKYDED